MLEFEATNMILPFPLIDFHPKCILLHFIAQLQAMALQNQ